MCLPDFWGLGSLEDAKLLWLLNTGYYGDSPCVGAVELGARYINKLLLEKMSRQACVFLCVGQRSAGEAGHTWQPSGGEELAMRYRSWAQTHLAHTHNKWDRASILKSLPRFWTWLLLSVFFIFQSYESICVPLSFCLSVCLSACPSVSFTLCVCMLVCLSVCLSHLCLCLPLSLFLWVMCVCVCV